MSRTAFLSAIICSLLLWTLIAVAIGELSENVRLSRTIACSAVGLVIALTIFGKSIEGRKP